MFEGFDFRNTLVAGGLVLAGLLFCPVAVKPPEPRSWGMPAAAFAVAKAAYDAAPATVPALGSEIMKAQLKTFCDANYFYDSDVDIFLVGLTAEQATAKIRAIYAHLRTKGDTTIVRSKLAVTFLQDYPRRVVQVVLRLYKSTAEVLAGFDVDACCVAYDGNRAWCTQRSRRALNGMVNVVDPSRQSLTYESRLFKYSLRGFGVCACGFDSRRVDFPKLFRREVGDVHGMARLLLLERLTDIRTSYNASIASQPCVGYKVALLGAGIEPNSLTRSAPWKRSPYTGDDRRLDRLRVTLSAVADGDKAQSGAASDYSGYVA